MFNRAGILKKLLFGFILRLILLNIIFILYFKYLVIIKPPIIEDTSSINEERKSLNESTYTFGNNWLRKNNHGLWEMKVSGSPFERGVAIGKLSKELINFQEKAFVNEIRKIIPSDFYLRFLKYFIAWFNRKIDKNVDKEYLEEIYGISFSASDEYNFIGPKYQRLLNYHGAHDIGHALQDLNMVGCTSFSTWNEKSKNNSLMVGRNFDFYVGEDFSKNKIIAFYEPNNGNKFMIITWGGMIGAVSGINDKGLSVTINASKSDIPSEAATPISILAREILQYSSNIDEAYEIAKKRKTFVSESILIGSKNDNITVIIEKSPEKIDIYSSENNEIICSNHFQSNIFQNDSINIKNINESSSEYRRKRVNELLNKKQSIDYNDIAEILRDKNGINNSNIGLSNEKSINQLIAHHSVIFDNTNILAWVSTNPYQLGEYICYDLNKIFNISTDSLLNDIDEKELVIKADTFLYSDEYIKFNAYKNYINLYKSGKDFSENEIDKFKNSNPEYFYTYFVIGNHYQKRKEFNKALEYYKIALSKEITTFNDKLKIEQEITNCQKQL